MKKEIFVADCETDPFFEDRIPRPFIWGAYNGKQYYEFKETTHFINFIKQRNCIVYAHNGGKFDWHFILEHIEPFTPLNLIAGRLAKFTIEKAEFRDSYNILPLPLAAYKKDDFEYWKMEKEHRNKYMPEIRKYLKNDCIYLHEIVTRFISDYGLNLTVASAAFKQWQKISGEKPPETTSAYYEQFAPFYYGGRVECFKSGIIENDFNVVDINSAYPFAMLSNHPYGASPILSNKLPEKNIEQCFIELDCISRGAFPFREESGLLRFPNDNQKRRYYVTGWEYVSAMKFNALSEIKIIKVYRFTNTINFKSYIDHFYKMKVESKKNNDKAGYINAKLFLNSLYGKFCSNPNKYKNYMFVEPRFIEAAEMDGYQWAGEISKWFLASKDLEEHEMRFYDLAVGASITGFVRAYMFESIKKCKGVIYCDTDSIAAEDTSGLDYHETKLGLWDIEADCNYGAVAGKKMYAFRDKKGKWKKASKGVKLSHSEIVKIAKGQTVNYKNIAPTFSIKKEPVFIERNIVFNAKTE